MKFEIKNRWTGKVQFTAEIAADDLTPYGVKVGLAVQWGIENKADLTWANLTWADLTRADLTEANLTRANLMEANLTEANLTRADLTRADLMWANLMEANLTEARDDFLLVINTSPNEVAALRKSLINGRVDGSTYQGECACLVGTIANAQSCSYDCVPGLEPNSSRPAERFFLAIRRGDTPERNPYSALAVQWIDEWVAAQSVPA